MSLDNFFKAPDNSVDKHILELWGNNNRKVSEDEKKQIMGEYIQTLARSSDGVNKYDDIKNQFCKLEGLPFLKDLYNMTVENMEGQTYFKKCDDITQETEKEKYKNILTSFIQGNNEDDKGHIRTHLNNLNKKSVEFISEVLESVKGDDISAGFYANLQILNEKIKDYNGFLRLNNDQSKNNIEEILKSMITLLPSNRLRPITQSIPP